MISNDRNSLRLGALGAALLALAAIPAAAAADDLRFSYTPLQPVVGQPMQFVASAYDPNPDPEQIDVFIRPMADGTCGATAAQEAAAGSTHLFSETLAPGGRSANPNTFNATFTPTVPGDHTACGYDNQPGRSDAPAEYTAEFTVTQGSGPGGMQQQTCVVPGVLGKRLADAKRALQAAHCGVGAVSRKKAQRGARGRVVSQSPRAGTRLAGGKAVGLVVGR